MKARKLAVIIALGLVLAAVAWVAFDRRGNGTEKPADPGRPVEEAAVPLGREAWLARLSTEPAGSANAVLADLLARPETRRWFLEAPDRVDRAAWTPARAALVERGAPVRERLLDIARELAPGDTGAAIECLRAAELLSFDSWYARFIQGAVRILQREPQPALTALQAAREAKPDQPWPERMRLLALAEAPDAHFDRQSYRFDTEQGHQDPLTAWYRAQLLLDLDRADEALGVIGRVLEAEDPARRPATRDEQARWHELRGRLLLDRGPGPGLEQAHRDFAAACELRPGEPRLLLLRALARAGQGFRQEALRELEQALAAGGGASVLLARGRLRLAEGQPKDALDDFQKAWKTIDPSGEERALRPLALGWSGQARAALGDRGLAAQNLEEALALWSLWNDAPHGRVERAGLDLVLRWRPPVGRPFPRREELVELRDRMRKSGR